MIRLFVGLPLPEQVSARLALMAGGIPGARWTEVRNLHVTLRFVGEVDETTAAEIDATLAMLRAPEFALSLDGFGTFGRAKPSHLWASVERVAPLLHLQSRVETALNRLGLVPEGRKFLPHVTLARLKDAPTARVQDFIGRNAPFRLGPWTVEHFTLFQSHLGRAGAEYQGIADYPLS